MSEKRQEKSLREFKQIMENLITLLCRSTDAHTVYMNWVNRTRRQFVMETSATDLSTVMFRDRVPFEEHFLYSMIDIQKPIQIDIPGEFVPDQLTHHYGIPPVRYLFVVPFVNRSETVSLTVLESETPLDAPEVHQAIEAYQSALGNVLNTWLELTDLQQKQKEWTAYEEGLEKMSTRLHRVELFSRMLKQMQQLLPTGGASLIARGMGIWTTVLNSSGSAMSPDIGQAVEEKSMVYSCLKSGRPEFSIHFNQNPKRVSSEEGHTEGATLVVPLLMDDRRQGAVLIYEQNPLVFTESVRHKLINLVRVAGLAMRPGLDRLDSDQDLLVTDYGSFIPDLWERTVESATRFCHPLRSVWFGFVTIENLPELRSRFRLEALKQLQRELVLRLNPTRFNTKGLIGFHSDYVFSFLIQDADPDAPRKWLEAVSRDLQESGILVEGERVPLSLRSGLITLNGKETDVHESVKKAKAALARAIREEMLCLVHSEQSQNQAAGDI